MARKILATLLSLFFLSVPAFAAEKAATSGNDKASEVVAAEPSTIVAAAPVAPKMLSRPSILPTLYGGAAALQAFDAFSTLKGINAGAVEANPVMKSVVGNPGLYIGLKATVAGASIMAAERMWRNNRRVTAILMMAASNGVMAAVAAHNASVLSRQAR